MAHESRFERPPRRGRIDDSGGDAEGGKKLYYHLTLLAENQTPATRTSSSSRASRSSRATTTSPASTGTCSTRHHEGLIATTGCLGGHVLQSLLAGDERRRARVCRRGCSDIFGPRPPLRRAAGPRHPRAATDDEPGCSTSPRSSASPLLATNDSHYVHRDDSMAHDALLCVQTGTTIDDPKRFKFEGHEHYLKTAAEMRSPLPRASRCVRQHALGRRARRCADRVRQAPASRVPHPRGFADDADYLRHLTMEGAHAAVGRAPSPDHRRAHRLRAPGHRRHGVRLVLPHRAGTSSATPASTASGSVPGGAARRVAPSRTACASPTSTRSSTTCCSSGSSTPVASRCPTSTWTSTTGTATR